MIKLHEHWDIPKIDPEERIVGTATGGVVGIKVTYETIHQYHSTVHFAQ